MQNELTLNEIKQIELEMLNYVNDVCKENGIKYFAIGGTLLGAVRHGGFIPWDDDIDIAMLAEDYNRFVNIMKNSNSQYRFDCLENNSLYPYPFGKICDKSTSLNEKHIKGYKGAGVFIDVFRIDGRGNTYESAFSTYRKFLDYNESWLTSFLVKREHSCNLIKDIYYLVRTKWRCRYNTRKWAEIIDKVSKENEGNMFCSWIHEKPFPKEIFEKSIFLKFENIEIQCPEKYDKLLSIKYGDYMTLPSSEHQISNHSFVAYSIQSGG